MITRIKVRTQNADGKYCIGFEYENQHILESSARDYGDIVFFDFSLEELKALRNNITIAIRDRQ